MIGTIGANVLGNMVTAPLVNNAKVATSIAGLTASDQTQWQDYGWQSSGVQGAQVTLEGKTVNGVVQQTPAVRGEPVPVIHQDSGDVMSQGSGVAPNDCNCQAPRKDPILPTEPQQTRDQKTDAPPSPPPPPVEDAAGMNWAMLVGAAAGAAVAKSAGYNLVVGAAAGALVGHFYAAGAYK